MNVKNTGVLTVIVEALIEHANWFFPEGILLLLSDDINVTLVIPHELSSSLVYSHQLYPLMIIP